MATEPTPDPSPLTPEQHAAILDDFRHNCPAEIDGGPGIEYSLEAGANAIRRVAALEAERDAEGERIARAVCAAFPDVAGQIDEDSGDEADGIIAAIRWLLSQRDEQHQAALVTLRGEKEALEHRSSTLEDAAFHFQTCRACADGGENCCTSGTQFAAFLRGEEMS